MRVRPGGVGPEIAITTGRSARRRPRRRQATVPPPPAHAGGPSHRPSGPPARGVSGRLRYLAGLDGLRALAVMAVLLYHHDYSWLPGGFLGVDVFFVLSGYLITALLLAEWQASGRVALGHFWLRRARRLLPALVLLLGGLLGYAALAAPGELGALRGDTLAAATYVTNWWLVVEEQSYFQSMARPSLLQHLWSLAVEGQFYLLWPLAFVGIMRWGRRALPVLLIGAGLGSAVLMAVLAEAGVDEGRLYYGTDTRAAALLLGAALASVWHPARRVAGTAGGFAPSVEVVGLAALALLGVLFWRLDEFEPLLYRGGFLLVALASVAVIAAVVHDRARLLPGALDVAPMRWLGTRSYAVYLWHWPVFLLTRPHLDIPLDGVPLFALRLAVTFALAEVSYWLVETPVRRGRLGAAWSVLSGRTAPRSGGTVAARRHGWVAAGALGGATVVAIGLVAVSAPGIGSSGTLAALDASPPSSAPVASSVGGPSGALSAGRPPASHATGEATPALTPDRISPASVWRPAWDDELSSGPPASSTASASSQVSGDEVEREPGAGPDGTPTEPPATSTPSPTATPTSTATPAATATVAPPPASLSVTALGDSVMLGAAAALQAAIPGIEVHGEVGLQASAALEWLRVLRDNGQLGDAVVIHIGTNGILEEEQFKAMMALLADVERVVVVNVKVPRAWEDPNNSVLAGSVGDYSNAVLVDWHAASVEEGGYFWDDGIHLRPEGAEVYASLIAAQVGAP